MMEMRKQSIEMKTSGLKKLLLFKSYNQTPLHSPVLDFDSSEDENAPPCFALRDREFDENGTGSDEKMLGMPPKNNILGSKINSLNKVQDVKVDHLTLNLDKKLCISVAESYTPQQVKPNNFITPTPRKFKAVVFSSSSEESSYSSEKKLSRDRNRVASNTAAEEICSKPSTLCSSPELNTPKFSRQNNVISSAQSRKFEPLFFSSSDDEEADETLQDKKPLNNKNSTVKSNVKQKLSFLKSLSPSVPEALADTEAIKYRTNFIKTRESLALKLYSLYNQKVFENKLPSSMHLEWNKRLLNSAGYFTNRNGIKISLSSKILVSAERLRDTLLHEMCHAAACIIDKKRAGHGPIWQNYALKCKIAFPEVPLPKRCHDYSINYRFNYVCSGCSAKFGRHKRSFDVSKYICKRCGSKFKLAEK